MVGLIFAETCRFERYIAISMSPPKVLEEKICEVGKKQNFARLCWLGKQWFTLNFPKNTSDSIGLESERSFESFFSQIGANLFLTL